MVNIQGHNVSHQCLITHKSQRNVNQTTSIKEMLVPKIKVILLDLRTECFTNHQRIKISSTHPPASGK